LEHPAEGYFVWDKPPALINSRIFPDIKAFLASAAKNAMSCYYKRKGVNVFEVAESLEN
jgi:hypothetical protein